MRDFDLPIRKDYATDIMRIVLLFTANYNPGVRTKIHSVSVKNQHLSYSAGSVKIVRPSPGFVEVLSQQGSIFYINEVKSRITLQLKSFSAGTILEKPNRNQTQTFLW